MPGFQRRHPEISRACALNKCVRQVRGHVDRVAKRHYIPAEPVVAAVCRRGGLEALPVDHAAQCVGKSPAAWQRWFYRRLSSGGFSLDEADHVCIHLLGTHPVQIYGASWWRYLSTDLADHSPSGSHASA